MSGSPLINAHICASITTIGLSLIYNAFGLNGAWDSAVFAITWLVSFYLVLRENSLSPEDLDIFIEKCDDKKEPRERTNTDKTH